jgi:glucokinase
MTRFIGVDLGGTRIKAGLVVDSRLTLERVVDVDAKTPADIVHQLTALVATLVPADDKAPIGLAAAGVLDAAAGLVRESPNFPAWRDFPLGRDLSIATGRTVVLENDANAVILGEARFGVARGARSVIGYTLGTGVGGGLVLDGRLYRGERGMAGELGHVTVEPEGRPCGCGNHGCLERYAGQVGLIETLAALPTLAHLVDGRSGSPADAPRRLAELAATAPEARAVLASVGRYLGQAAAALVHALDVTTLVLAGGIAHSFELIAPAMEAELRARTFRSMSAGVRILKAELGASGGVLGAAAVAADHLAG